MDAGLRRQVWQRANGHCEYCRMRQEFDELTFQIEHIIPKKHHGSDTADNLALACFACNNHKGSNPYRGGYHRKGILERPQIMFANADRPGRTGSVEVM